MCSQTPTVYSATISRFLCNLFRMWHLPACQHMIHQVIWPSPVPSRSMKPPGSNVGADTWRYKYLRASQRVKTERGLHGVERGLSF